MNTANYQFHLILSGVFTNPEGADPHDCLPPEQMSANLQHIIDVATGNGLFTGSSETELDNLDRAILVHADQSASHTHNHAYEIAFEVTSADEEAEDVTPAMLRMALVKRIMSMSNTEIIAACGSPYDTCEI